MINLSSIAAIVGRSGPAAPVFNDGYAAASRAVSLLTETWAREAAPEVRVNEIMVGFVDTRHGPGTRGWGLLSEAEEQAIRDHTLLGRTGSIADVVKAEMFILRDGLKLGGRHRRPARQAIRGAHQRRLVGLDRGIVSTTRPPKITTARSQTSCTSSSSDV